MIIIANTLVANGGTTFIIRMSKEYFRNNNKLKVIVLYENYLQEHLDELKKYAEVHFIKNYIPKYQSKISKSQLLPFIIQLKKEKIKDLIGNEDVFHVMGIFGYILAKKIKKITPSVKITIGVYHQNEFMYSSINGYFNNWVYKEMNNVDPKYFIFFNNSMRNAYSNYFNYGFKDSPILPIGITLNEQIENESGYNEGLMISVGNLVGFKTYNKHIINLMPSILKKYPKVKFDIYGIGEEFNDLSSLVESLNLNENVFFKGLLDYNKFDEIVSKAHVFFGNGTAVLEAANAGTPSITGIESCEDPITYGYVHQIEGYDYNEYDKDKKYYKYETLLNELFEGGENERTKLSKLGQENVKKFDIINTVNGFNKINSNKEVFQFKYIRKSENLKLFISFIRISILDVLKIDQRFKYRRNQGETKK